MVELRLLAPEPRLDALCEALEALEALSVSVEDADALTDAEQPLFGEPGMVPERQGWQRSRVLALFADAAAAEDAARVLPAQDFWPGCELQGLAPVPQQDWVRLTQSQFEPIAITPQFWIVPSWHEPPPAARQVLRLDPGLAFGTGTHPTTRMCLRWLAGHPPQGLAVLDYGCGSGILAIAAALLGAARVDAVDIDPAAVQASRDNAAANGVSVQVGAPELATGAYPLVLANILATPLKLLAPLLGERVAPGGRLVLAGLLERQTDELRAAYAPWLPLRVADCDEGWVLLVGQR